MAFDQAFYDGLAETARSLLSSLGQTSTLNRYTDTVNATAGTLTRAVSATSSCLSVRVPVESYGDLSTIPDGLAKAEKGAFVLNAKGNTVMPQAEDELVIGSVTWLIVGATPINPAGTALIHKVLAVVK